LPWVSPDALDEQRLLLLPSEFERRHMNRWTESEDRLTTLDDVRACVGHSGDLEPMARHRYVVSLDIGLVNDRTAAVVAHGEDRPDGLVIVVDRVMVWSGTRERPVDLSVVEAWVEAACRDFRAPLVFDPYQAAHLTQRLKAHRVRVEQFTFTQSNAGRLAVTLFRLLRDRLFDLPDDANLVEEVAALRLRENAPGAYRIDHDSNRHDDQAIALAMAAAHIVDKTRRPVSVSSSFRLRGSIREGPPPPTIDQLRQGIVSRSNGVHSW
jgi:phage terminase large subunit-like protein